MTKRRRIVVPSGRKKKPRIDWGNLKKVGYWYWEHEPELPHPKNHIGEWDADELKIVVEYLQNPVDYLQARGMSPCRMCDRVVGSRDHTDGVYRWPQGLEHYLVDHSVKLPKEFIQHILLKSIHE